MSLRYVRILFGEGYRVLFLCAGAYAVFAIAAWEWWLGMQATGAALSAMPFAQAPHYWHAHEMIFGYATAAIGGFFLTAVPNWTGTRAARHVFIALAAGVWLAGRAAVWWSASLGPVLVAIVDLTFLPIIAAKIGTQLAKRPKPQNVMFLGLLAIVWTGNLFVHLAWSGVTGYEAGTGLRIGLYGLAALIAVLGGRVTPAFTRNAMTRAGIEDRLPRSPRIATIFGIASAIALPVAIAVGASDRMVGTIALAAGVFQCVRLAGWRTVWTLSQPILWSLHLGFAMLALGYLSLGLASFGIGSEIAALHLTGIGAVGGMTLAVMSRAILGHTGRPLVAPTPIAIAYGAIAAAALTRAVGQDGVTGWYFATILISGALWIAAFALFVVIFFPALIADRTGGSA